MDILNVRRLNMGSFAGHVLPGAFMLLMGTWWLLTIMYRYFQSLSMQGRTFYSTASFKVPYLTGRWSRIHIEAILKIICCTIGMIGEISTAFHNFEGGYKFYYGNVQHTTMFFFFGLTGMVDLLILCSPAFPKNLDYVMLACAFFVEGLLFYFHLSGRGTLDLQLHYLLIIAIAGNVIFTLIEMKNRRNALVAFARTFCLILQGTWFFQIAFILYKPYTGGTHWMIFHESQMNRRETEKMHDQKMLITCMFTWHCAVILFSFLIVGCVFRAYYKCISHAMAINEHEDTLRLIKTDSNGQRFISLPTEPKGNDDSESESVEFEQARGTAEITLE